MMANTRQTDSLSAHENNFDFLRLTAALLVLFSHCYPLAGRAGDEPISRLTGYLNGGDLAVAIFFVISGFLITASRTNCHDNLEFGIKRAARILPGLALVVLLSIFMLGPLCSSLPAIDYFTHTSTWRYLTNTAFIVRYQLPGVFADNPYAGIVNGSLWTLPAEVAMYAAIAFLGWINRLDLLFTGTIAVVATLAYFLIPVPFPGDIEMAAKIRQLSILAKLGSFFFCGAFIFLCRDRLPWRPELAAALLIAVVAGFDTRWGEMLFQMALPYLVLFIARAQIGFVSKLGKYGDFSYGVYIFAFPLQQTVIAMLGPDIAISRLFFYSLAPTLMCAIASWHFVEQPALRWSRNRLARRSCTEITPNH